MDPEKIVQIWMQCWIDKKFPIKVYRYLDWRRFRDFWLENPLSDINKVVILYEESRDE